VRSGRATLKAVGADAPPARLAGLGCEQAANTVVTVMKIKADFGCKNFESEKRQLISVSVSQLPQKKVQGSSSKRYARRNRAF
jgi:hypothetical protein